MGEVSRILTDISKHYKKDIVGKGKDPTRIPSGIFAFDLATGGGVPRGRVSMLYGPEASMKTTVALKLIAQAQREEPKKTAVFVDVEKHFLASWAERVGVDCSPERLAVVITDTAEETIEVVESLIHADDLSLIVVDSLAAMVSTRELDSEVDKAQVGTSGLMINKFYRRTSVALGRAKSLGRTPTLVLINQIRYKIGVMYGSPEQIPGGPAFAFASSLTIRLYGRDEKDPEVSKDLPAFKKITIIIKKHKVPVIATNAEFLIAIIDNPRLNLKVGDSYDMSTIMAYLKSYDLMIKGKQGWELAMPGTGEIIPFVKQDELKARLIADTDFCMQVKQGLIGIIGGVDKHG